MEKFSWGGKFALNKHRLGSGDIHNHVYIVGQFNTKDIEGDGYTAHVTVGFIEEFGGDRTYTYEVPVESQDSEVSLEQVIEQFLSDGG